MNRTVMCTALVAQRAQAPRAWPSHSAAQTSYRTYMQSSDCWTRQSTLTRRTRFTTRGYRKDMLTEAGAAQDLPSAVVAAVALQRNVAATAGVAVRVQSAGHPS